MPAPASAAGARTYVPPPRNEPTIIASFDLNPFEAFAVTLTERNDGRRTAALVRVKRTPDGLRRLSAFEFGTHRLLAISSLIDELMRAVATRDAP